MEIALPQFGKTPFCAETEGLCSTPVRADLEFSVELRATGGIRRVFRFAKTTSVSRDGTRSPLHRQTVHWTVCFSVQPSVRITTVGAKKKSTRKGCFSFWRRRRDSNPRAGVTGKLISSQPRYDHFDTSPYCQCILAERTGLCQSASTTLTGSFSSQQNTLLRTTSTSRWRVSFGAQAT